MDPLNVEYEWRGGGETNSSLFLFNTTIASLSLLHRKTIANLSRRRRHRSECAFN